MDGRSILLVEDSAKDETLVLRSLERADISNEIVVARDGAEAVEFFSEGGPFSKDRLPAVVLLDLKLPKLSGLEVLERLRAERRTKLLPVVVLTSSDDEGDIDRSYEHGANSYVRKPVNMDELSETVRRVGHYWLTLNIPPPRRE